MKAETQLAPPRMGLFNESAVQAVTLAIIEGRHSGMIRLEHLFLGLAITDVSLVVGIQLPLLEGIFPRSTNWVRRPLVSKAWYEVVFELAPTPSSERGSVTPKHLSSALKQFLAEDDFQKNLEPVLAAQFLSDALTSWDLDILRGLRLIK
ncbi:MAG TPA: hypothetical protein VLV83_13070 [Acidobacteriota bacterium]|nr:hypothetical protein [Acidobacteriota bacterium]